MGGMPNSDMSEQAVAIRINGKFGPYANHDYIEIPPDMKEFRKAVVVGYIQGSARLVCERQSADRRQRRAPEP